MWKLTEERLHEERMEGILSVIGRMLKLDVPMEQIMSYTGLTLQEIEQYKRKGAKDSCGN